MQIRELQHILAEYDPSAEIYTDGIGEFWDMCVLQEVTEDKRGRIYLSPVDSDGRIHYASIGA